MENNKINNLIFEACVGSLEQAKKAEKLGANRIELCYDLERAGLTPSLEWIKEIKNLINIPVFVIIRPTDRDFYYNNKEFELMKNQIIICKEHQIDGVVFGVLNENSNEIFIDYERNKELIEISKPMKVTFHMAFDEIGDKVNENSILLDKKYKAIDQLIELGFDRILTKGGFNSKNASEGKEFLRKYNEYANKRIIIMPGGGITNENKYFLGEYINTNELHGTKIVGNLN